MSPATRPDRARSRNSGPGRPRDPSADARILQAAIEVLIDRGVERAGIEEVARRAGVTKVTVYRRWSNKTDLLAAAIESFRDSLPNVADADPAASLPDRIEDLLPAWARELADPRWRRLTARLLGAGPDHPELLARYRELYVEPRRQRARHTLAAAHRAGELRENYDADVLIDMLEGAIVQRLLLHPEQELDPKETESYLRSLLIQAGFRLH